MRRIRERDGRIVVVAGPIVIHTGAGKYLAWLVRYGYVKAFLGGNAVAVHDIEQEIQTFGEDLHRRMQDRAQGMFLYSLLLCQPDQDGDPGRGDPSLL